MMDRLDQLSDIALNVVQIILCLVLIGMMGTAIVVLIEKM